MVSVDRYDDYLSKKVSLGTQIFIFCQIWQFKKQYYEKVNKFWLVSYEIEQAPTYEKSHSVIAEVPGGRKGGPNSRAPNFQGNEIWKEVRV